VIFVILWSVVTRIIIVVADKMGSLWNTEELHGMSLGMISRLGRNNKDFCGQL
jgi:hypothetical protein